jgi:anti-anti-sigma factor
VSLCELTYRWHEDVLVARLEGEIDMSNADQLREALTIQMTNRARGLVLELSALTYIDSAGIHVAYDLRDDLSRRGQTLRLVVPDGSVVDETLRLADLHRTVGMRASLDEALDGMPASGSDDRLSRG